LEEGDMIMGVFMDKEGMEAAGLYDQQTPRFGDRG